MTKISREARSGQQIRGAGGLAAFQRVMGGFGVAQGKALADIHFYGAGFHHIEQFGRGAPQFRPCGDVMEQSGAGEIERALGGQDTGRERRDRARGIAEAHHQAAWLEAIERGFECVLAHRVIDHGQAIAAGDLADFLFPAFHEDQHMRRAGFARQCRLGL